MKKHLKKIFIFGLFFQFAFSKNMDLQWSGMSCWFDALIHCLSEYDEMNDFLREKYKKEPLSQADLDSLKTMNESAKKDWVEKNFARIYIALIDKIHNNGTDKTNLQNYLLAKKSQLLGNITQIDLINSLGEFGKGNDPLEFYPDFFNTIIKSIGNHELPGITATRTFGKIFCPMGRIADLREESSVIERFNEFKETLSRIAIFPARNSYATSYEIKQNIIIKNKQYNFFAIMWASKNDGHIWAYVKSKKDNCWYCYNSLGDNYAKIIDLKDIELTPIARKNKNMKPYIIFYTLDENSSNELSSKLIKLKNLLKNLNLKLELLKEKLSSLKMRLASTI